LAGFVYGDRIGVAADVIVLFEEGQFVMVMQEVAAAHPGYTSADDRGPHRA
jgi:hypothetical protein